MGFHTKSKVSFIQCCLFRHTINQEAPGPQNTRRPLPSADMMAVSRYGVCGEMKKQPTPLHCDNVLEKKENREQ